MSDSFSAELWQGVSGVYDAILAHPFLAGLTDGSLPHDAFAFYVVQDAIYLRSYARALAGVAAPANLAYTSYLLATVGNGSYAEGVGAVLPCYWIYWEVGKELLRRGSPDPRYQRWIDMYGSEEFGSVAQAVIDVTDEMGPGLGKAERDRVHRHFRTTSRYEWMFWDMGYRQEAWPV